MKRLELTPTRKVALVLILGGKEYELVKPRVGEIVAFEEALNAARESKRGVSKIVLDFLAAQGLPVDVACTLDESELEQIIEALTPEKKA